MLARARNYKSPWRSKKYLDWVKTLDCYFCGKPADDPHHITGTKLGGTGTKISDHMVIPLCRHCHVELHATNMTGTSIQPIWALQVIELALKEGILCHKETDK